MDDDLYKGLDENENDTLEMITKSPSLPLFEEDICFDITHVLTQLFFIGFIRVGITKSQKLCFEKNISMRFI